MKTRQSRSSAEIGARKTESEAGLRGAIDQCRSNAPASRCLLDPHRGDLVERI